MTGSQRAALLAQANGLSPVVMIGKSGITDTVRESFEKVLAARELIKIKTLESCPTSARENADALAALAGADVIRVVGSIGVLYKYNPELHKKK